VKISSLLNYSYFYLLQEMFTKGKGNLLPPHSEYILEATFLQNNRKHRTTQCGNPEEHNSILITMETSNITY